MHMYSALIFIKVHFVFVRIFTEKVSLVIHSKNILGV